MLGIAVLSTFSIALAARPISAENFICDALDLISEQDCDPPLAPTLDAPVEGAFLPNNEFDFSWLPVEDKSGVSYELCVSANGSFVNATCSPSLGDTSYPAANLITNDTQTIHWRVIATDGAGNESKPSDIRTLTIDATNPEVALNADLTLIGGNTPKTKLTGKVSDENVVQYELNITNEAGDVVDSVSGAASQNEGAIDVSREWDATGVESGVYTATLSGTDKAGRVSQASILIEVDNDGPELTISGSKIIKGGSITPTVTVSDPHDVTTYTWVADKTNSGPITFDDSVKEPEFTPLIQGNYVFTLTVTDGLGNTTSDDFEFGYASELEPLPLPTTPESTIPPSVPAAVSPTANPTRDPREDIEPDDKASQVLGSTTSLTADPVIANNVAALTPTENGWKILGILWYWWLAAIVGVMAAWIFLKKVLSTRST